MKFDLKSQKPKQSPTLQLPAAPPYFSPKSKALWQSILTEFDLADEMCELLRVTLENLDLADQARATLRKEGLTIDGRRHPAADLAKQHDSMYLRGLRQLALDVVKPSKGVK